MLTEKERQQVVIFLHRFSNVSPFPIEVDPNRWEIRPGCKSKWKSWACKLAYAVFIAHALYKAFGLLNVLLFLHDIPLHQILIHGIIAAAASTFVFWQYDLFWKNSDVSTAFWKLSLTGNVAWAPISPMEKEDDERPLLHRMSEKGLQDLIAISLPYMLILAALTVGACYVLDPTMKMLVYTTLPASYQNWFTFGLSLLEEMRVLGTFIGIVTPVWQVQIVAIELVSENLERIIESASMPLTNRVSEMGNMYLHLRCLQLYTTLLNIVNRHLIFTWKLLCLGLCIFSGYAAIAHFTEHPVFGVMYYVLFVWTYKKMTTTV